MTVSLPLLAIVGRPNVGKSTLFNRIVGSRRAIVGDESGITRDRLYGEGEWRGRQLRLVDTGGIIPDEKDFIPAEVFRQARVALEEAAAIVMVVDGRTELAASDLELARLLRRTGKPLFLAINKIDTEKQQALANEFHRLGIRELFPISAEHGRGVDDLLDAVLPVLPSQEKLTTEGTEDTEEESVSEIKVAIIGHPNVGKSTLLNRLTGSERAIVSPVPGTTRDAVDEGVRATQANARGPRGVRATLALRAKISELRTGAVYLCHKRKRGGENPSAARESCQRTPQTNPDCRNQSLSATG